jgi:hypothetical protein
MRLLSTRNIVVDLILLAALTAVALKLTHGVRTWMDLALVDESGYLQLGVNIPRDGLPHASWGVLYSIWYFVLDFFTGDRVSLQFRGFRLLVLLMATVPYLAMRRLGALPGLAAAVSFVFLLSASPFPEPRPMHLAVVVLSLFGFLAASVRSRMVSAGLLTIGFLLASLARVELFLCFLVMASCLGVAAVRRILRSEERRATLWATGVVAVVSIAVISSLGSPISGGRSGEAFGQHFALNYVQWTGTPLNPWTDTDLIIEEVFGEINGLGSALVANPAAFGRHVSQNLLLYGRRSLELILPVPRPLPEVVTLILRWAVAAGLLTSIALVAVLGYLRKGSRKRTVDDSGLAWFALYVGLAVSVVAASAVVIYPREHYLVGQTLLVGAVIAVQLSRLLKTDGNSAQRLRSPLGALGLGIVVLLLMPNRAAMVTDEVRANPLHQPGLKTVETVRALGLRGGVRILHDVGLVAPYLGDDVIDVNQSSKPRDQAFSAFRQETGVNVILVRGTLLADTRFRDDPEWRALISDPEGHGFRRMKIANTRRHLLVDRSVPGLLGSPAEP